MTINIYKEIKALPLDLQKIIIDYHQEIRKYISSKKKISNVEIPISPIYYYKDGNGNIFVKFNS